MDYFHAIFLGLVQGLTEFLPISSSGHLVLIQRLIPSFKQPGVLFDVLLHLGTLFAVLIYFRRKLLTMNLNYLKLLLAGTLPAVILGLIFRDQLEYTFKIGGIFLAIQFFITSLLCFYTDKLNGKREDVTSKDALFIGLGQAVAILPAISRSGITIFTAVKRGINKQKSAEFSFILSIPAILGANILEILSYSHEFASFESYYLAGFLAALVFGYFSISWTIRLLNKSKFRIFAIYTLAVGLIALLV